MSASERPAPRRLAVALEYSGQGAPRVTAKGEAAVADTIARLAEEHGIPLQRDEALAAVLTQVELNQEIPEALYRAVAEVIAFAYIATGRFPEGFDPKTGKP
jgi:flagellar biosynthesis protein